MPKTIIPLFLIKIKDRQDLINKLFELGLKHSNFIDLSAEYVVFCYLKTAGTMLRSELHHEPGSSDYYYKLFYEDIEICESSFTAELENADVRSSVKNLDKLPQQLILDKNMSSKETSPEEKQSCIMVPLGSTIPYDINNLNMMHLKFVGIDSSNIIFDIDKKLYYLKVEKTLAFSLTFTHSGSGIVIATDYVLKYAGETVVSVYYRYHQEASSVSVYKHNIALARKNLENIIVLPSLLFTKYKSGVSKLVAKGTIESGLYYLKKNEIAEFNLEHCPKDVAEKFNYSVFNHEKVRFLIDALRHNHSLERLDLGGGIRISKSDFIELACTLKAIKTFKELMFTWSKVEIDMQDMAEINKAIDGMVIEFLGTVTNDETYCYMTDLIKATSSKTNSIEEKPSKVGIFKQEPVKDQENTVVAQVESASKKQGIL